MISDSQLVAIHIMATGGLSPERIADVLGVSVDLVQAALNPIEGQSCARVKGSSQSSRSDQV